MAARFLLLAAVAVPAGAHELSNHQAALPALKLDNRSGVAAAAVNPDKVSSLLQDRQPATVSPALSAAREDGGMKPGSLAGFATACFFLSALVVFLLWRLSSLCAHVHAKPARRARASGDRSIDVGGKAVGGGRGIGEGHLLGGRGSISASSPKHHQSYAESGDIRDTQTWFYVTRVTFVLVYYFVGYLTFGMYEEKWNFADTMYWVTVSTTTVGYGDMAPIADESRYVAMIYILFGISIIFTVIASIFEHIMDESRRRMEGKFDLANAMQLLPGHSEQHEDHPADIAEPHCWNVTKAILTILVCMVCGTMLMYFQDELNFADSVWWSFTTVTTVGYGDVADEMKASTKTLCTFFILVSVSLVAVAIAQLSAIAEHRGEEQRYKELMAKIDFEMLEEFDLDGDGVDVNEYVIGMLQLMEIVEPRQVRALRAQFAVHDKDKSGRLDKEDLRLIGLEAQQRKNMHLEGIGQKISARDAAGGEDLTPREAVQRALFQDAGERKEGGEAAAPAAAQNDPIASTPLVAGQ